MDELILALAPAFVAGLAVQRVLEIVAGGLDIYGEAAKDASNRTKTGFRSWFAVDTHLKWAKAGCALVLSVIVGAAFAANGVSVLSPLKWTGPEPLDIFATILVVSAGTEGMNSLLKWLGYTKDDAKAKEKEADAKAKEAEAGKAAMEAQARKLKADAAVAEDYAKKLLQPA